MTGFNYDWTYWTDGLDREVALTICPSNFRWYPYQDGFEVMRIGWVGIMRWR